MHAIGPIFGKIDSIDLIAELEKKWETGPMAGRSIYYLSTSKTISICCFSQNIDNVNYLTLVTLSTS